MGWIISATVNAVKIGLIFAIAALGLSYILLIQNYFNFTAGAFVAFGAFIAYSTIRALPDMGLFPFFNFGPDLIIAALVSMGAMAIIMTVVDKLLYRRLRNRDAPFMYFYLTAFGMVFVIRSLIQLIWGPTGRVFYPGGAMRTVSIGGTGVSTNTIFVVILVPLIIGLVYYFQYKTRRGRAMLAFADNRDLAQLSGVSNTYIHTQTTVLAGLFTGIGGVLYALCVQLRPMMGWYILLSLFVVTVCGGEGAILGTLAAGLLVGFFYSFPARLMTHLTGHMFYGYKLFFVYILFIILMVWRGGALFTGTPLER